MAHPQLVPIFFADDADAATLTQFSQWIVGSSWLTTVGKDYGVGSGSVLGVVHRSEPAPDALTDTQLVDLVYGGLADGTIPKPASGDLGEVLYMIHLPFHTTVTDGSAKSCVDFGGYHNSARRNGVEMAYAVINSCPMLIAHQNPLEIRQLVASHELIEAATDPFPVNHPGFQIRNRTSQWRALGDEVADLCTRGDETATVHEAGFVAQRSWSNTAASTGDPCVPALGSAPYFNLTASITTVPRIPPGSHQSFTLYGWDTSDMGLSWNVAAQASKPTLVTLSLGARTMTGDAMTTLDVSVPATTDVGTYLRFFVFSYTTPSAYQMLPMFAFAAAPCSSFTDCESCTSHTGCGFCSSSGACEAAGPFGSAGSCPASAFATWTGSCPGFCAAHNGSCADCASQFGCGWCNSGGEQHCVEAGRDYARPAKATCDYADWSFTASYCPM